MNLVARVKPQELKAAEDQLRICVNLDLVKPFVEVPDVVEAEVEDRDYYKVPPEVEVTLINEREWWDNAPVRTLRAFLTQNFNTSNDPSGDTRRFIELLITDPAFEEMRYNIGPMSDMNEVVDTLLGVAQRQILWNELLNLIARVKPEKLREAEDELQIQVTEKAARD